MTVLYTLGRAVVRLVIALASLVELGSGGFPNDGWGK
jgi:hypothetical protein